MVSKTVVVILLFCFIQVQSRAIEYYFWRFLADDPGKHDVKKDNSEKTEETMEKPSIAVRVMVGGPKDGKKNLTHPSDTQYPGRPFDVVMKKFMGKTVLATPTPLQQKSVTQELKKSPDSYVTESENSVATDAGNSEDGNKDEEWEDGKENISKDEDGGNNAKPATVITVEAIDNKPQEDLDNNWLTTTVANPNTASIQLAGTITDATTMKTIQETNPTNESVETTSKEDTVVINETVADTEEVTKGNNGSETETTEDDTKHLQSIKSPPLVQSNTNDNVTTDVTQPGNVINGETESATENKGNDTNQTKEVQEISTDKFQIQSNTTEQPTINVTKETASNVGNSEKLNLTLNSSSSDIDVNNTNNTDDKNATHIINETDKNNPTQNNISFKVNENTETTKQENQTGVESNVKSEDASISETAETKDDEKLEKLNAKTSKSGGLSAVKKSETENETVPKDVVSLETVYKQLQQQAQQLESLREQLDDGKAQKDFPPGNGEPPATDCHNLYKHYNITISGVYKIQPAGLVDPIMVFCEMVGETGWTIIQRRTYGGGVSFDRDWKSYKTGFGDLEGDHWLGNEFIHKITSNAKYTLRVEWQVRDGDGWKYADYGHFVVDDEIENYRLWANDYNGNAGNALMYHTGKPFSTRDRDNDEAFENCASRGGWWYTDCHLGDLNGYLRWHNGYHFISLGRSVMKLGPPQEKKRYFL